MYTIYTRVILMQGKEINLLFVVCNYSAKSTTKIKCIYVFHIRWQIY